MSQIHLLDELTANQIAAGEVIERPAAVIKELIENSLDAQAQKIIVEIINGGLTLLKVSDDGQGISAENLPLVLKRHATSKLRTIQDLNNLQTLGFRGEALPSIAAVAQMEILTRMAHTDYGYKLVSPGNSDTSLESAATTIGTTITITDLFYNTPARKKFLRPAKYESGLIYETIQRFALCWPAVDFVYLQDGQERLNTIGIRTQPDLMQYFYGSRIRDALITVKNDLTNGQICAQITLPTLHRPNRKGINFFLNRRYIYSPELLHSLEQAYENILPKGQFPYCLLSLSLDPATIDVNIHPSKLEVRWQNPTLIEEITKILRENLNKQQKIPQYFLKTTTSPATALQDPKPIAPGVQEVFHDFYTWQPQPNITKEPSSFPSPQYSVSLNNCRVIGQLAQTFILVESEAGLYIIDQHIAQERVIFEKIWQRAGEGTLESQVLLQPLPLHLSPLEEEIMLNYILPLADLGIIIEIFGPRSYLLRAIPAGIQEEPHNFFYSLLEHLEKKRGKTTTFDLKKEFLIHSSCKMSIKANTKLSLPEMEQLIFDLSTTPNYLTCPHGRPIIYQISHQEILKAFKRI